MLLFCQVLIQLTKHAILRMTERKINEDEIYEIFEHPVVDLLQNGTVLVGHTHQLKFLCLVLEGNRLITLWPASRRQRAQYKRRIKP